ncbi:MAG: hypothetical protein D6719_03690, partial [Candidatus Dadabacteria bacterium]
MKVDMVMPQMGESIAEATISRWLKNVGDPVEKDETILEISTDKVDSEIPAPASGTLVEVLYNEGDVVPVKEKIAVIDTDGGAAVPSEPASAPSEPEPVSETAAPQTSSGNGAAPASASVAPPRTDSGSNRFYSPLVRSLAEKHGVPLSELDSISGSGQGGRVTKQDFLNYLESRGSSAGQATI